jgi:hypothetical protein
MVNETGQPYAYTGDDPVNAVDPLGLCSTQGSFLVPGACHWTSHSWVTQTENTLQGQKGGGFSITNGLKAVADYGAAIGSVVTSTATLGHVQISAPYCGFGWASDVGTGFGYVAIGLLGGGAGAAGEVADGTATVEEVEAGEQAVNAADVGGGGAGSEYGPFYRLESPTQTPETAALQESSGEIWGHSAQGSDIPSVKAYNGPLPEGARGIEFTTDTPPTPTGMIKPGQIAQWYSGSPGVEDIDSNTVRIRCTVTLNTQC